MGRRSGRSSTALTKLVLETYGNACALRLPGCTRVATTKDHRIPYSLGGDDSLENFQPACRSCNSKRGNRVLGGAGFGARVCVVIGPPAGGKSTYVREHATITDVAIDLDAIARALMPLELAQSHTYPAHVRHVAIGARKAAIERATRLKERVTVWIIHAIPTPDELAMYRSMHWQIITCDPGRETVLERCRTQRPEYIIPAVDRWYAYTAGLDLSAAPAPAYDQATAALDPTRTPALAAPSREW